MRIKVSEPVRQNVEGFLKVIREEGQKGPFRGAIERTYEAWLHRETGQLYFGTLPGGPGGTGKSQWKPVQFSFQYDPAEEKVEFLLEGTEEKERSFEGKDLNPLALKILRNTMQVFKRLSQTLQGPSDFPTKMAVLSKLTTLPSAPERGRNLIIDLWHHVDRKGAESLLAAKPVGAYLFRKDAYASILEEQLEQGLSKEVLCFTLTYSGENQHVLDYTIVHVDGSWQIYNDDPSLKGKTFSSLEELIASFKGALKYPFYSFA
jgi:hypothetical protein